jgi:hypothetical protein
MADRMGTTRRSAATGCTASAARVCAAAATLAVLSLCTSAAAAPRTLLCGKAERDTILVDGVLTDWQGVKPLAFADKGLTRGEWDGAVDLSFELRCNVDPRTLHLALEVRDDAFVRTPAATPGEDHVVVTLGGRRFTVFPGDHQKHRHQLRGAPAGVRVGEGRTRHGYVLEIAIPRAQVPGLKRGAATVPLELTVVDVDSGVARREKSRMSTGRLTLTFPGASALIDNFLLNRGLKASDIRYDRTADVGGDKRVERVVIVGRFLAVLGGSLGDNYYFQTLPYANGPDLKSCELVDVTGDRKAEIVVRYLERGGGGSRLVYAVYLFEEDKLRRVFAQELEKRLGPRQLQNRIALRPARRGRGREIVVSAGDARGGVTASTWREQPAEDVSPILLPWGPRKQAKEYSGAGRRISL